MIEKVIDKSLEEMSELQFELLKFKKKQTEQKKSNIQREIADLQIQLDKLTYLFGEKQIKKYKKQKLNKS